MQRPTEVQWFERIYIATLLLGVLQSWLAWPELVTLRGPVFLLITQFLTFGVMITLMLLTSRRRSSFAKWIMIGLFVVGMPMVVKQASEELLSANPLIAFIQVAGQLAAYGLLFTPAARRWFKGELAIG